MSRKPALDAPTRLELKMPESKRARLDLHLFSEVEGRVPMGSYQKFFISLMDQYFEELERKKNGG